MGKLIKEREGIDQATFYSTSHHALIMIGETLNAVRKNQILQLQVQLRVLESKDKIKYKEFMEQINKLSSEINDEKGKKQKI